MSSIKNLPQELLKKYQFEPTIQDIFVEGSADKSVLEWYLRETGCHNVIVREITTVDLPADFVTGYLQGLPDIKNGDGGNRERIIAFAKYLQEHSIPVSQVKCVADRDLGTMWASTYNCDNLLFYDFSCLEMYCFNESAIFKFLTICCNRAIENPREVLISLSNVLKELFLTRLANWHLGWCLSSVEWLRYCNINGFNITFDRESYIRNYLTSNLALLRTTITIPVATERLTDIQYYIQKFEEVVEFYRGQLPEDSRLSSNGHDFLNLLSSFTRDDALKKSIKTGKILLHSLEKSLLDQNVFFISLRQGLN